jgi:large subunit ribosomal protein L29
MDRMKEFRDQSVDELQALHLDLSKEIFEIRNEIRTTQKVDKPHLIKKKKKDRARVLTLLNQKGKVKG